jgi:hypothetical protein
MSLLWVVYSAFSRNFLAAAFVLSVLFLAGSAQGQSSTSTSANPSAPPGSQAQPQPQAQSESQPQVTKSPLGKEEEAARAAARAKARHFDRVLIIVLENVDYEVASQDKSYADLAAGGASLTNFHALFHPSYPNYLAMVAGTDFDIHRRGRLFGDNQVDFPADGTHQTIADRLIASGLDFKQYAEELPDQPCPWSIASQREPDRRGNYSRRHVPFLSFRQVQQKWCDRVIRVDSSKSDNFFVQDVKKGLVAYSFYTPNMNHDGHDTSARLPECG